MPETPPEEPAEELKPRTFKQKFSNFMYHNKWWLLIAVPLFCIGTFLIVNILSEKEPDLTLLILINNDKIEQIAPEICKYFEQFTPDLNGDGEVIVGYMYIPIDESMSDYYIYLANSQNLSVQLETYDNLIVIADSSVDSHLNPKANLYDISLDYRQNSFISDGRILIGETDWRFKLGYKYRFTRDAYIGIRRTSEPSFQPQYDILKKVIASLNKVDTY